MSARRRYTRFQYAGLVFISWQTFDGQRNHALGKCIDVSERGMGLALPARIPAGSFVRVTADGLNLNGSATVRNITQDAGRYVVGLELSMPLDPDILASLDETETEMVPAGSAELALTSS